MDKIKVSDFKCEYFDKVIHRSHGLYLKVTVFVADGTVRYHVAADNSNVLAGYDTLAEAVKAFNELAQPI